MLRWGGPLRLVRQLYRELSAGAAWRFARRSDRPLGEEALMNFRQRRRAVLGVLHTHLRLLPNRSGLAGPGVQLPLACVTGVLFGALPALPILGTNVNEALKQGTGASMAGFHHLRRLNARRLLVVGEIALSLVLMVGAGLMVKSLMGLQAVDLGFSADGVLTMSAPSRGAKPEFYEQLLARVKTLRGSRLRDLAAPRHCSVRQQDRDGHSGRSPEGLSSGFHSVLACLCSNAADPGSPRPSLHEQDRAGSPR